MALSQTEYKEVKAVFDKEGIPEYVWYPIMMSESGGNKGSRANTSREDSRGLFQINIKANPQWKNTDLYDPVTNATIAAKNFIKPAYVKAGVAGYTNEEDITAYVWKNGIRPKWTDEKNKSIRQKVKDFLTGGGEGATNPIESFGDKLNPFDNIGEYINELLDRFKTFAWVLIPLLVGLIILVFTLKNMFLDSSISTLVEEVIPSE